MFANIRAFVLGRPLHQDAEAGERLSKRKALAIFSSDAISSSAYATEEIVLAFMIAGAGALAVGLALEVAIAIAALLAVVAFSYRQVCIAYPNGGGSYSVSKANFGRLASLVAASALLIDYNLTAAVSTSSARCLFGSRLVPLDDFQRDPPRLGLGERPRRIAVQRSPRVRVDLAFQGRLQGRAK